MGLTNTMKGNTDKVWYLNMNEDTLYNILEIKEQINTGAVTVDTLVKKKNINHSDRIFNQWKKIIEFDVLRKLFNGC